MKKSTILILLVSVFIFLFTVSVYAAEIVADGECPENIKWEVDSDGVLTISGTGMMRYSAESNYVVPWAEYADFVTKVIVEEGITYIDRDAFMGFSKLEKVVLPEGLTGTGFVAFANCTALKEIVFPDSVESIGQWSLSGCTALESVTLGNGILHAEFVFDSSYPNLKAIYFNGTKEGWETPIRVTGSDCRPIQTLPEGVEVIFLADVKNDADTLPEQPPVFACVARKTGSQVEMVATVSNMPEVKRICAAMYDESNTLICVKTLTAQEAVIVDNADIKKGMFFAWNESFEPEDKIEIEFE